MEDEAVLTFIAERASAAECVFSVCTGALVCGAAGLLRGKRATTHWASVQFLKYFGATAVDERVAADGTLVSAAGLTTRIEGRCESRHGSGAMRRRRRSSRSPRGGWRRPSGWR